MGLCVCARLGRLAQPGDMDAALHEALHNVVCGGVGVRARQDGPHGVGAPGRAGNPGQHLQQRQQRPWLPRSRRPLRSTVPSEGTRDRAVLMI